MATGPGLGAVASLKPVLNFDAHILGFIQRLTRTKRAPWAKARPSGALRCLDWCALQQSGPPVYQRHIIECRTAPGPHANWR